MQPSSETRSWSDAVQTPPRWECGLWEQVLVSLEEAGKTGTSHYVMAEEAVFLCRLSEWRQGIQRLCELEAEYG